MKLRQVTRTRPVTEHIDGETVTYDERYQDMVPKIPFNLDALLRKVVFAVALLMTAGAIVWGTVAIGSMLATLAPAWAAYLVAGAFDLAWAACLAAEYHNRYDVEKVKLPRNAGVGALAISMAAIVWDGHLQDALVVGFVGAGVSLVSKGVWFIGMQMVAVKLDKGHQMLLRKRQQEAGLRRAMAQSKRDLMLMDDETARLLAALEFDRGDVNITVEQANTETNTADHVREQFANVPANKAVTSEFAVPEPASIAELAREHLANGSDNKVAVAKIMEAVPTAKQESVAATVRRERKKLDGPYL